MGPTLETDQYYLARRWRYFDDLADALDHTRLDFEREFLAEDLPMLGTDTPQWVTIDESRALILQCRPDEKRIEAWIVDVRRAFATAQDASAVGYAMPPSIPTVIRSPFQFRGDIAPSFRAKA